ncbi:hypothetical protein [Hyphomonas sp.]|uniref:hypothetical protein n=1 Tax=Hyphomonas sp. TaxID=87 RepID=UPI00391BD9D8
MSAANRIDVRPIVPGDFAAIDRLMERVWFARRSAAGFDWLCHRNPGQSGLPAGWVAEDRDGIVRAFLGNFVQRGWYQGEANLIASGYNFVSDADQGGRAVNVLRACLKQDSIALVHTLTANPFSGRLHTAMRLTPYPETGTLKLDWMTQPVVAAIGAISWRAHGLAGEKFIRRIPDLPRRVPDVNAWLAEAGGDVLRIAHPETDARLASFDLELRAGARLFAERSPAALQWRLSDPDDPVPPVLVAYPATGAIRGLALFQFNKPSEAEPPYLDVMDLVSLDPEDSTAVQALIKAGLMLARRSGAARLRLSMVSPGLLRLLGPYADQARKTVSTFSHAFYKPKATTFTCTGETWQPLPYDGDNGPCLRAWRVR